MPAKKRREFKQSVRVEIAERAKDANGTIRCEGVNLRTEGRCFEVIKGRHHQIDHINPNWAGGDPKAENGQMLCPACFAIKNKSDATAKGKNDRLKAKASGVETKPKQPVPQRPKPEKPQPKGLPARRGGIYARYFGVEE